MRKISLFAISLLFVGGYVVYGHYRSGPEKASRAGQDPSSPQNMIPAITPGLIDGAKHPELIPDSTAYRLFFITVAEPLDATDARKVRQRAYLLSAGLQEDDLQAAADVLATFKAQCDELVEQYNASVEEANTTGGAPDFATFQGQLDELVQSTRDALQGVLSPDSMDRFDRHIQREKKNMKIMEEVQ